mmetsp:Transcript_969/g.1096  ORF Transcript_969/g.1096 Transcript_969/m.1096 type:complete len:80 (-) Transcript_969:234-473(-)
MKPFLNTADSFNERAFRTPSDVCSPASRYQASHWFSQVFLIWFKGDNSTQQNVAFWEASIEVVLRCSLDIKLYIESRCL